MAIEKLFGALNISSNGLTAQRKRLDSISSNIANANTTRTEKGTPYRRKIVRMEAKPAEGFEVVLRNKSEEMKTTNPDHIKNASFSFHGPSENVSVKAVVEEDMTEFKRVYDPSHPDAGEDGYVLMPNINLLSEMVDMITASRSYEANLTAIDSAKKMARAALDI